MKKFMRLAVTLYLSVALIAALGCKKKEEGQDESKKKENKKSRPEQRASQEGEEKEKARDTRPQDGKLPAVKLSKEPSKEEQTTATELAKKLADKTKSSAEHQKKENARSFLILAAQHKDAQVVSEALRGLYSTYGSGKTPIDDDFINVVGARLGSADHKVLAAAMRPANLALQAKKGSEPLLNALAKIIASNDSAAQHAALGLLSLQSRKSIQKESIARAVIKALDSKHAHVVAKTLSVLRSSGNEDMPKAEDIVKTVEGLLKHTNPAVRGEACEVLAAFVPFGIKGEKKAAVMAESVIPLLNDKNAFTKSRAAGALARVKYKKAIHEIVKHLDDKRKNTYDIKFMSIWGRSESDHFDGSPWSRVDDAMLHALKIMTVFDGKNAFSYEINSDTLDKDIEEAVKKAKKWYKKNKESIDNPK